MDYDLTKEQQYIQKAAREFALGEFPDVAHECDVNETIPAEILKKASGFLFPKNTAGRDSAFWITPLFWKNSGK